MYVPAAGQLSPSSSAQPNAPNTKAKTTKRTVIEPLL
jgi:hypothetical protein